MDLTIVRSQWQRGSREDSYLLNPYSGMMCCLGFYCRALGVDPAVIQGREAPSQVAAAIPESGKWLLSPGVQILSGDEVIPTETAGTKPTDGVDCANLMKINDALAGEEVELEDQDFIDRVSETVRETTIASIFATHGVTVTYVD